jgi:bifunctional UDP-N-acetylglucosamine pyrophosphorylase / glucosamine-1-phosphate N-acetyltransferase
MTVGIILAGGKGKRFMAEAGGKNKVVADLAGKPLVVYGTELFQTTTDKTVIVVSAMAESVRQALIGFQVDFAIQPTPLGTGDAVKAAISHIDSLNYHPDVCFVGYADHMMLYTPQTIQNLSDARKKSHAAIALFTTFHPDSTASSWGRIVRDANGFVNKIVEKKDATDEEIQIQEHNAGFYCFDYHFLKTAIHQLQPSPVTQEYYLTDVIAIAQKNHLPIVAVPVPFSQVGFGVNTPEELAKTTELLKKPEPHT